MTCPRREYQSNSHSFELKIIPRKWFESRSKDPERPHESGDREVSLKNGSRKVTARIVIMESVRTIIRREEPQNQHLNPHPTENHTKTCAKSQRQHWLQLSRRNELYACYRISIRRLPKTRRKSTARQRLRKWPFVVIRASTASMVAKYLVCCQ